MSDFDPVQWITTQEAAELTGYASVTLRLFARQGKVKSMKRGRDWFLNRADVLAYVENMRRLGDTKHNPWRPGGRKKKDGAE